MNRAASINPDPEKLKGVLCGVSAFLIWGLSPLYWKLLSAVPAFEIINHRIIWSFLFLVPLLVIKRRWGEISAALLNPRTMSVLLLSSILVAFNWLLYIWAINHDRVLQASLGYYINPLVNVLLGMLFLKERLRRAQIFAFVLAAAGVLYLTLHYGKFPWISLTLAFSFGFYGLIHKIIPVGSLAGLSIETLLLSVPASIWLFHLNRSGVGAFLNSGGILDLILVGAALVTALPLLLFTQGTRRLNLSTVGFLQYIAPTCMFLLGVFVFKEPFAKAQVISFILIWTALVVYSLDSALARSPA
ncbi:MAG: EamA family transporter RarD, partial [Deltaproteobacteria bacterium]|nr:EamA family transporter RarD [Deltaproteobacteria bacterium]